MANLQVLISAFYEGELALTPSKFEWVDVGSVEEAAEKVSAFVDENGCGARDWFGGIVRDEKKAPVAVISLRGRIQTVEENATFIQNAKRLMKK